MAAKSRRIANLNGATTGPLNQVAEVDSSKALVNAAVKNAPKDYKATTNDILVAVKQMIADAGKYQLNLDAKATDVIMGRMASLLDEVKESFAKNEIEDLKNEILDEISGSSVTNVLKNFLLNQITELFDNDAKKEDIEELKEWMQQNLVKGDVEKTKQLEKNEDQDEKKPEEAKEKDEEAGDFKDSTPANNFYTLQTFVQKQFDTLNENLKNIPGQSGIFSKMKSFMSNSFLSVVKKISSIGKSLAKGSVAVIKKIGGLAKGLGKVAAFPIVAVASGVKALGKGMKSVMSGIGKIGSKVGGAIAAPFKKIGGFFSSLNPFKRKKDKKEEKKQAIRDKIMNVIAKVIDKVWKVLEPFVDKILFFTGLVTKFVIVPIAIIALKVLLIVAAITLLAIGLYLAYQWVKKKIVQFWNYITSGELWEDIKAGMLAAWEWMKDFGKWIGLKLIEFGKWYLKLLLRWWKFLLVDIPVWIWKKLIQFGNWFYDNYIDKYLVQPFKQYIWEPVKRLWNEKIWPTIEPFVKSLTELKNKIVNAFSAWDSNKSIWENLKNISGIIKDSVVEWWNESPFKVFYENNIKPFVESAVDLFNRLTNLGGYIKDAILDWWNGDSSLAETLGNIGGIVWQTIKDWWSTSIFKEKWEKLKDWISDVTKPIRDWYEKSPLKPIVDKIADVISTIISKAKELIDKIGNAVWSLPMIGTFRPFGFIAGKEFFLNEAEEKDYKAISEKREKAKDIDDDIKALKERLAKGDTTVGRTDFRHGLANYKHGTKLEDVIKDMEAKRNKLNAEANQAASKKISEQSKPNSIAQQQVQQAMQPVQSIEKMQTDDQKALQASGNEITSVVEKKEESNDQFNKEQAQKTDEMIGMMNAFMPEVLKKLDEPQKVPMFVPYQADSAGNSANMQSF